MRMCLIALMLLAAAPAPIYAQDEPSPVPPGDHFIETTSGGTTRRFILHIPPGYDGETPTPLIFLFHGRGMQAPEQILLSQMNALADEEGFLVVYPQAFGTPPEWFFWVGADQYGIDDVQFVRDLITLLGQRLNIDPERIYAAGYSNGGGMVNQLACHLSDQIAAIAQVAGTYPVSELVYRGCAPERPVPALAFHGTGDTVLPYQGEEGYLLAARQWAADWAARNGCDETLETFMEDGAVTGTAWTGCRDEAEVRLYLIEEWGHDWPRTAHIPELDESESDTTDIDASAAIWEFFAAHPLPPDPSEAVQLPGDAAEEDVFTPEAGDFAGRLQSSGIRRDYLVHIPPGYEHGTPMPMVLNFHGYTMSARAQMAVSQMNAKADEAGFIAVYPEGLGDPQGWYYGPEEIQFVRDLIASLSRQLSVDPARIYATGLSNGGGLANQLACDLSDQIAAVAPVAAALRVDVPCTPERPVPLVAFHGAKDFTAPYAGADGIAPPIPEWAAGWAARNGCGETAEVEQVTETVTATAWTGCLDDADILLYTLEEGEHIWPRDHDIPNAGFEVTISEINANDRMWAFFAAHPLPPDPAEAVALPERESEEVEDAPTELKPGDFIGKVESGGQERAHVLHIPPAYDGETPMPLVLAYHGYGSEPTTFALASGLMQKADEAGFLVVFPAGSGDPRSWNGEADDVQYTRDLIAHLQERLPIDPARIYVTGFSNGGRMVNRLGCELADTVAAIAPVGAGAYPDAACSPARPVPVIAIHGTADNALPYEGDDTAPSVREWVMDWVRRNGCETEPAESATSANFAAGEIDIAIETWSGCEGGAEVVLHTYKDWGHFWPRGAGGDAIWSFFAAHPKKNDG